MRTYALFIYFPLPARPRTAVWSVSQRAEPLSRLHLSPSKGISFFILKFQQKLLKLISPLLMISKTLLDLQQQKLLKLISPLVEQVKEFRSTIVEIIEAYQPSLIAIAEIVSTIVEIIEAYQPRLETSRERPISTIVEIIEAYQPLVEVYPQFHISTIVEIIEAYQPIIFT